VQLQNEVSAVLSAEKRLRRVIWMPSDVPKTSGFLDQLTRDAQLQEGSGISAVDRIIGTRAVPYFFVTGDARALQKLRPQAIVVEKPDSKNEVAARACR